MKKIPDKCRTCARKFTISQTCAALNDFYEDCWCWTDDKDWYDKLFRAVQAYTELKKQRGTL